MLLENGLFLEKRRFRLSKIIQISKVNLEAKLFREKLKCLILRLFKEKNPTFLFILMFRKVAYIIILYYFFQSKIKNKFSLNEIKQTKTPLQLNKKIATFLEKSRICFMCFLGLMPEQKISAVESSGVCTLSKDVGRGGQLGLTAEDARPSCSREGKCWKWMCQEICERLAVTDCCPCCQGFQ